jgi:group I intron endonuclease
MEDPVIYWIKNRLNGKFYVGSTTQRYVRWKTHKKKLRAGTHHCAHLQAAWKKYGEDAFDFSVVEKVLCVDDLQAAEDRWLIAHVGKPYCYNAGRRSGAPMRGRTGEAHPSFGKVLPEEFKVRLREAALRQWEGSDPRTGTTHSEEARAKISAKVQAAVAEGRGGKFIPTEETRAKMSAALIGNRNAKGHVRTEEHRRRLSEANKGNQNWLGKTHSETARAKMGRAVVAISPDGAEHTYATISMLREVMGLTPPTVHRALESGTHLTKGRYAGWMFYCAEKGRPMTQEVPEEYADLPRTRTEAKRLGAKKYFTGDPCTHGHIAPRYTKGQCVVCAAGEQRERSKRNRLD